MNPPSSVPEKKFNSLVAKIQQGNCVLVLGPRIPAPGALACEAVLIDDYLAGKLCAELGETAAVALDLRRAIARYERHKSAAACRGLVQELVAELDAHCTDLHLDLASLPFQLILSATPDRMMAGALRAQGKPGLREAYYDYCRSTVDDSQLLPPSVAAPLVYSLFGRHDHPESMVLNDKNLLDYLVNITRESPALPDTVRAILRAPPTVFLFVGFGFANWWLRLLLKVLEVTGVENRTLSLALEDSRAFDAASTSDNQGYFESLDIYIQSRELGAWAKELVASSGRQAQAAQALLPPAAPVAGTGAAPGPLVFLSYAREDADAVDRLRQALARRGVTAWQDVQNMYAGQNWEQQLNRVVKRADYFVFVQTDNMDERDRQRRDGVYNRELDWALERMRDKPYGTPFLFHVTVGPCRPRPEPQLARLHRIAVDSDAGTAQLVDAIVAAHHDASAAPQRDARPTPPGAAAGAGAALGI